MLVSVIIPVYNAEKYIAECLESVLNQTWGNIEIIVVDNNSIDESWSILKGYEMVYPDKLKVFAEKKQGASAARNKGIEIASGQWIQFLDADDLLMKNKIEHQIRLAEKDVSFIAGTSIYEGNNGKRTTIIHPITKVEKGLFEVGGTGNTCANFWNKKFLDKVGGFDELLTVTEDPDLMFRLFQVNENVIIDNIPKTIVRNINPNSLSKKDLKGAYQRHLQLRQRILNHLKKTKPAYLAEEKEYFQNMMYKYVRLLAVQDLELGVLAYQKYLPKRFNPSFRKDINNPLWNVVAVRLLGFRRAEEWKNWLKRRLNF